MLNKTEQSGRAPNANEKPEDCYCSALPKGSGLCLPCYTRWLAGRRDWPNAPAPAIEHVGPRRDACWEGHACRADDALRIVCSHSAKSKLMSLGRDPELPRACLNRGPKKRLNCPGWE